MPIELQFALFAATLLAVISYNGFVEAAGWLDAPRIPLPNWIHIAILVAFDLRTWFEPLGPGDILAHVLSCIGVLIVGLWSQSRNGISGGVMKTYASAVLYFGPGLVLYYAAFFVVQAIAVVLANLAGKLTARLSTG